MMLLDRLDEGIAAGVVDPPVADSARTLRVGMVVYGDATFDSRVQREARSLADAGYLITVFCLPGQDGQAPEIGEGVRVVARLPHASDVIPRSPSPYRAAPRGSPLRQAADRAAWLWGYARNVREWGRSIIADAGPIDIWHAHDYSGLVAVSGDVARTASLVYDVHDIFVEAGVAARLPQAVRWAFRRHEERLMRRADAVVTVNVDLAALLARRYRPASITVVHNCPPRWAVPEPRPDLIREAAGIPAGAPVALYHGVLGATRGIETLCEAMHERSMQDVHVALLGYGQLRDSLVALSRESRFRGRLHVLDPVRPDALLPWVASADVGVLAMPPATLNLYLSTPNKLFECLAAGTPVVVSDLPAVRRIVLDGSDGTLGVTCRPSDARDLSRAITSILTQPPADREALRRRCATAARERWNWEHEAQGLIDRYASLAATPGAPTRTRPRTGADRGGPA